MSESPTPSAREVVERFLAAALDDSGETLADLYGDPTVIEMPFAPPGFPKRTETSNADLRARFKGGAAARVYDKVDGVVIHETTNAEVVIVEYDVHGHRTADGEPFVLSYVNIMTIRHGKIVHSKDHSDPINAAKALGMLPRLIEALSEDVADQRPAPHVRRETQIARTPRRHGCMRSMRAAACCVSRAAECCDRRLRPCGRPPRSRSRGRRAPPWAWRCASGASGSSARGPGG